MGINTCSGSGYCDTTMLGISSFGLLGNLWYSSSVTKGIKGLNNLSPESKQVYNISLEISAANLFSPWNTGFKDSYEIN